MVKRNPQVSYVVEPHQRTLPTLRKLLQRIHVMIILVSLLLSGVSLSTLSLFALRHYAENNLQLVASTISYSAQRVVLLNDRDKASDLLQGLSGPKPFSQATIFNASHQPLASWQSPEHQEQNSINSVIARWLFPRPVTLPVVYNQREVGRVTIIGDASVITDYIYQAFAWLASSLLITALVAVYLSHRMHAGIIQGLRSIASVAHDVRKRRAFCQRVPSSGIAELNKLSMDFNGLLDELAEWQNHMARENADLAYQAAHDSLTGLPNRAQFERALACQFSLPETRGSLAVLFIDGDHFKQVNDTWGHATGDCVLGAIAERLRANLRKEDLVARFGGDEFAIMLTNAESGEQAAQVARHIMAAMLQPIILPQGGCVQQSLSIGIALGPRHSSPQALLAQADAAMYHIKQLGGGWYFSPTCWQTNGDSSARQPL
ncbi:diguanylate cyclase domain-containing protein [Pantoea sp. B65]|uniref:diguanylate cyclase domain-containing protein n=1 Tax=Pantoea sp. B65 TaxID=2813359 RepID=UPI0039B5E1E4